MMPEPFPLQPETDGQYMDPEGVIRRPGSLVLPDNFVSSFPPFEGSPEMPLWDDADIRKVISDPNRRNMRTLFPFRKYGTNQHSTSACNGHAAAIALTRARKLRGIDDGLVFSGSFTYSRINGGRDNGSILEDGLRSIQENGECSQTLVTWNMIYPKQQPVNAKAEAAKHKGLACYRAMTRQGWRTGLAAGYMGICAVHAGPRFDKLNSSGISGVQSGKGNHACAIMDMRIVDGVEVFDLVNSWGGAWGSGGCTLVTWEHFEQTFGSHSFYLLPSTSEKA